MRTSDIWGESECPCCLLRAPENPTCSSALPGILRWVFHVHIPPPSLGSPELLRCLLPPGFPCDRSDWGMWCGPPALPLPLPRVARDWEPCFPLPPGGHFTHLACLSGLMGGCWELSTHLSELPWRALASVPGMLESQAEAVPAVPCLRVPAMWCMTIPISVCPRAKFRGQAETAQRT